MAKKINVKSKKLYRSLRIHGLSKKKAGRVLADVSGSPGGTKKRKLSVHPVSTVKGGVQKLRKH
jgi:hypothetical protein